MNILYKNDGSIDAHNTYVFLITTGKVINIIHQS